MNKQDHIRDLDLICPLKSEHNYILNHVLY